MDLGSKGKRALVGASSKGSLAWAVQRRLAEAGVESGDERTRCPPDLETCPLNVIRQDYGVEVNTICLPIIGHGRSQEACG